MPHNDNIFSMAKKTVLDASHLGQAQLTKKYTKWAAYAIGGLILCGALYYWWRKHDDGLPTIADSISGSREAKDRRVLAECDFETAEYKGVKNIVSALASGYANSATKLNERLLDAKYDAGTVGKNVQEDYERGTLIIRREKQKVKCGRMGNYKGNRALRSFVRPAPEKLKEKSLKAKVGGQEKTEEPKKKQ